MIERNRNTDKQDISRLENKIKDLETDIVIAKKNGEERRLDKLEQSLTNTSMPALDDNSLLDGENADEGSDGESCENGGAVQQHKELLSKLLASSSAKKLTVTKQGTLDDSVLKEDELAILGDYASSNSQNVAVAADGAAIATVAVNDVIDEYDEYEK